MSTTQRVMERLPEFFKTRSAKSLLFQFIDGFGNDLKETERDIFRIMRGHWIDTAKGVDLDKLGAIFKVHRRVGEQDQLFRRRIKRAVQEYKGGGTVSAIELALKTMLGLYADQTEIVEFPLTPFAIEIEVSSGDTWRVSSLGIRDVVPKISLAVQSKNAEVRDPSIRNVATGQSIGLTGVLKSGQEAVLSDGKLEVDGVDLTEKMSVKRNPPILRKGSDWQYTEFLMGKIGVFDAGHFDESFFATPLPKVRIRFEWTAQKASTVEIRIHKSALEKAGLREEEIIGTMNAIKATGIEMVVTIPEITLKPSKVTPLAPLAPITPSGIVETVKAGDVHA